MPDKPMIFPVTARSHDRLRAAAGRLAEWLAGSGQAADLHDVGYTLARRRPWARDRQVVLAQDRGELADRLGAIAAGRDPGEAFGGSPPAADRGVVFVFSGHGSQWAGMGAELLAEEPAFASVIEELEPVFRAERGGSLHELLAGDGLAGAGPELVQPAIFASQVGLAAVWEDYGVRPAAVIGQSMGEVAAAVVCGGLSLGDAARVICRRSDLMAKRLLGEGATALLELPSEEAERLAGNGVEIAVYTSTRATVVAGDKAEVEALVAYCNGRGLAAYEIEGVQLAAHSRLVEPVLAQVVEELAELEPRTPAIGWYPTALADPQDRPAFDARYWAGNLRNPVRLAQGVTAAMDDGFRVFLELSPHPLLTRAISDTLVDSGAADGVVVETLRRNEPARWTLARALARLGANGAAVDWSRVYPSGRLQDLPTTAWQHQEFPPVTASTATGAPDAHPLLGVHVRLPGSPERHVWQVELDPDRPGWLTDHRIGDAVVLPGSAYAEIALAAATEVFQRPPAAIAVGSLEFRRILPLDQPVTLTTTVAVESDGRARVEMVTERGGAPTCHASAWLSVEGEGTAGSLFVEHATAGHEIGDVYARLRGMGMTYGPAFSGITLLTAADGSAAYRVERPDVLRPDRRMVFHPALLDACVQGALLLLPADGDNPYLPTGIGSFRVLGEPGDALVCRARMRDGKADVAVSDEAGRPVAELAEVAFRRMDDDALPVSLQDLLYSVELEPEPLPTTEPAPGNWLVSGAPDEEFRAELTSHLGHGDGPYTGVVLLGADGSAEDLVAAAVRLVNDLPESDPPRLYAVLRGNDLGPAGLPGLLRTLRAERPELRPTLVALDEDATAADLAAELMAGSDADEVVWRGGVRHLARLTPVPPDRLPPPSRPLVRPGASYAIAGGLGGLGLATARWLAEQGAGRLVLNARSAAGEGARRVIAEIEATGTRVSVITGDIARPGLAERLVRAGEGELRGVVHAAMVLDDASVADLDAARIHQVWSPKAEGAWRLHEATEGIELDWWVCYSSAAGVFGSAGQGGYAAANSFLDALVHWRRSRGLPALAVDWGPWAEVGRARDVRLGGIGMLEPRAGFAALAELITRDCAQFAVVRLERDFADAVPQARRSTFLARLVEQLPDKPFDIAGLARLDAREQRQEIGAQVRRRVCQVMGFAEDELPADRPLVQLGLDSLAATKIKSAVRTDLGLDLPVSRLLQGASVHDLTGDLVTRLDPASGDGRDGDVGGQAARRARSRTARVAELRRRRQR